MLTVATIAAEIERAWQHALPGREAAARSEVLAELQRAAAEGTAESNTIPGSPRPVLTRQGRRLWFDPAEAMNFKYDASVSTENDIATIMPNGSFGSAARRAEIDQGKCAQDRALIFENCNGAEHVTAGSVAPAAPRAR